MGNQNAQVRNCFFNMERRQEQECLSTVFQTYLGSGAGRTIIVPWGFDCSGYTQYVFRQIGISIPRTADTQYYSYPKVSSRNLQPGDLVFFETYEPGPSHVGIYIGDGKMLQAGSSTGVTVSDVFGGYWGARYIGAARVL